MEIEETETQIHEAIASWLNLVIKRPSRWHTVEVSNQASGRAAMLRQMALKRRGVVTGWPDIEILWAQQVTLEVYPDGNKLVKDYGCFKLIFLEVKTRKGALTAKQQALHKELKEDGHDVFVVRSLDDAKAALKTMLMVESLLKGS